MSIAITCNCSARLEIDEKFAGQSISCPDCQQTLHVPDLEKRKRRTSNFAIASIVLALAGAFSILGTLAAIACGIAGILRIKSNPDRLAGTNLAIGGIALGTLLTGLSLLVYCPPDFFGLDPLLRRTRWIGKLEFNGSLEVKRPQSGFAIVRPSRSWGVIPRKNSVSGLWDGGRHDFIMVNPSGPGYVFVLPETLLERNLTFDHCKERGKRIFCEIDLNGAVLTRGVRLGTELVPSKKGNRYDFDEEKQTEFYETKVDKIGVGKIQTFLLRIIRKKNDSIMYVVAAGTEKSRFKQLQKQLRKALDSFRPVDRPLGGVLNPNFP